MAGFKVGDRVRDIKWEKGVEGVITDGPLSGMYRVEYAVTDSGLYFPDEMMLVKSAPVDVATPDVDNSDTRVSADEALDRIAELVEAFEGYKGTIKHRLGASPSGICTTLSSFTLRETVRTLDTVSAILRETGRLP